MGARKSPFGTALSNCDGNLQGMAKFTDEARRRLATGWNPRVCTLREYARRNGVSERAVRLWRSQLRVAQGSAAPGGSTTAQLQHAVDALRARLVGLEEAVDAARDAVAAAEVALVAAAACRTVPAGTGARIEAHEPLPARPKPMPRGVVFWG